MERKLNNETQIDTIESTIGLRYQINYLHAL
jgi:hypothetical protein